MSMRVDKASYNWAQVPLFADMPSADIARFVSTGFCFVYQAGGLVLSSQDPGETFFIVLRGLAKLSLVNARKDAFNAALFVPGDFFGEMAILDPSLTRSGDIYAVTELEVMSLNKREFLRMTHECGILALNLARTLASRLRGMNQRLVTEVLPSPLCKVAHTLMSLSVKGKRLPEKDHVMMPPLSVQDWALFCYTTPDVFKVSVENLKQLGTLDVADQQLIITDPVKLAKIAKGDR